VVELNAERSTGKTLAEKQPLQLIILNSAECSSQRSPSTLALHSGSSVQMNVLNDLRVRDVRPMIDPFSGTFSLFFLYCCQEASILIEDYLMSQTSVETITSGRIGNNA
jgi:hypothetical protein